MGKIFKFEATWHLREDCSRVISEAWLQNSDNIQSKLENCKTTLIGWRRAINRQEWLEKQADIQQLSSLQSYNMGDQNELHHHL